MTHGWLVLDKPLGVSSAKAVAIAKRALKAKKIGHTGTLDPLASGVLPLAIGEATKLTRFLFDAAKEYEFTVQWGTATETDDVEGAVTHTSDKIPSLNEIEGILSDFTGVISQTPPIYSAIKVGGERAYKLARLGEAVTLSARDVQIHTLMVVQHNKTSTKFKVGCGKGTYVRSLARDIAIALNTYGHVIELRRTKVGKFAVENAILLENLDDMMYKQPFFGVLLPLEEVLDDIPVLTFSPTEKASLVMGQKVVKSCSYASGTVVSLWTTDKLFALGEVDGQAIKPIRILNI